MVRKPTEEKIKVVIPACTVIHSTHPTQSKIVSTRAQNVTIIHGEDDYLKWCTQVEWAGTGSYWRWAEITDEILNANPKLKKWINQRKKNEAKENTKFKKQK